MASRSQGGKSGQNNIDRQYNMTPLLQFQQEQVEKRYSLEYIHRQKYSFIAIVGFNVLHIIYGFLTTTSLTQILYPILNWLMIFSLLFSIGILYLHNQYIKKNNYFQILIRLSSIYFYCSHYLCVDHLEMGKTAILFISSALSVSIHMVFTNMLTIPHWKIHLVYNFISFSIVQIIVFLCSRDSIIKFNYLFFIFTQGGMYLFAGFFEKFIREFWIHLEVSKKQNNQFQYLIEELPQPFLILDQNCDVHLCNIAAQKFFQTILPPNEPEGIPRNANSLSKLIHRLKPQDFKIIENLVNQVEEKQKICSVTFQKKILEGQEDSKLMDLTFIGSSIKWKPQKCILLQIQEAEKIIEKEIEQKTITIEKYYEVENPQQNQDIQKADAEKDQNQNMIAQQYTPIKPQRPLAQVDNVFSITLGNPNGKDVSPDISQIKDPKKLNISSPNQSPINFTSPPEKINDECIAPLYSTQDNSEGEVNINVDDEIYKHFSFIESGLSNLLIKIISKIQNIKGKKINLSFGSLENSPNIRQDRGSHHNISGNKTFTFSNNLAGNFPNNAFSKEATSPQEFQLKNQRFKDANQQQQSEKMNSTNNIHNMRKIIFKMQQQFDKIPESQAQMEQQPKKQEITIDDLKSGEGEVQLESDNEETNETVEQKILQTPQKIQLEYKYNEICTILLFDQSSLSRQNIPYQKYDLPNKFNTFKEGEQALNIYFENIRQGVLFHFMILGIEASNGLNGLDVMQQIRNYEKENPVPRTYLVASFNSIGNEVGGQTKSVDTFLFKGFDQAFERPLSKEIINNLIQQRSQPEIVFPTEEDFVQKYKYMDKFTIIICDDVIQTAMMVKDHVSSIDVEVEVAKSEKSFINLYQSSIESGRLYHIVMIAINSNQMSGIEIVKKIREYEAEKKAKKTFIVGLYRQLNETIGNGQKSNSPEKYKEDGFDEIIYKPIEKEAVIELIERIRGEKEIKNESGRNSQNTSLNFIKSPQVNKANISSDLSGNKSPSISEIIYNKSIKKQQMTMEELEQLELNGPSIINKVREAGIQIGGVPSQTEIVTNKVQKINESFQKESTPNFESSQGNSQNPQVQLMKQATFSQEQAQILEDLEEKALSRMFNKVKQNGIKIEGEKSVPPAPLIQKQPSITKLQNLEDLEEKALKNMFNKIKQKGIQIEVEKSEIPNASFKKQPQQESNNDKLKELQTEVEKPERANPFAQKKPLISKEQAANLEDLEEQALNNMFKKAKQKNIQIEVEKPEKSTTNLPRIQEVDEFDIKKQSNNLGVKGDKQSQSRTSLSGQSAFNNDNNSSQQITQSPNLGNRNSESGTSLPNMKSMKNQFEKFDQFQQRGIQHTTEDQAKPLTQPSPQLNQQGKVQSPNINNSQQKSMIIKNDTNRQSPIMSYTSFQRTPVQSFKGLPNSQMNIATIQKSPPLNPIFKYNEKPTFLVMEDSSLVMMNISFMKYEIPKVLETATTGEMALEKYMNTIKNNTLYNFIIIGMNTQKGLDGNEVLKRIRDYETTNNVPRTYLIASFNSIGSQIGGQTYSKDTFIYRGFDDAIEKPIKTTDINAILKSRATPQIIYSNTKNETGKVRFFDSFTILICDDQDQISLSLISSSLQKQINDTFEYCWNGTSLYDKYMSAANSGRIFNVIFTQIRPIYIYKEKKQQDIKEDALLKIRQYEKDNKLPRTLIIGYMRLNQKNQPSIQELKNEGYDDIIDICISEEDLKKLIVKLKLTSSLKQ